MGKGKMRLNLKCLTSRTLRRRILKGKGGKKKKKKTNEKENKVFEKEKKI